MTDMIIQSKTMDSHHHNILCLKDIMPPAKYKKAKQGEFEDTKEVAIIQQSKKVKKHNYQTKKCNGTNNDLQSII